MKILGITRIALFMTIYLLWGGLMGQDLSLPKLEGQYLRTVDSLAAVTADNDSLQQLLEVQSQRIDLAKNEQPANAQKIAALMSSGLRISENLSRSQTRERQLQENLRQLGSRLSLRYAANIDSLDKRLQTGKNLSPEFRAQLRTQLTQNVQRYLMVTPLVGESALNPQAVYRINLSGASDSLSRSLAADYLNQMNERVNQQINNIAMHRREMDRILRLEQKTREFIDEVEDEIFFSSPDAGIFAQSDRITTENQPAISSMASSDGSGGWLSSMGQLQSFVSTLNQVNITVSGAPLAPILLPEKQQELTLEEYQALLLKIEKRLALFQDIIRRKLADGVE